MFDGRWTFHLNIIWADHFSLRFAHAAFVFILKYERGGRVHWVICFWRLIQYKENTQMFLSLVNLSINKRGCFLQWQADSLQLSHQGRAVLASEQRCPVWACQGSLLCPQGPGVWGFSTPSLAFPVQVSWAAARTSRPGALWPLSACQGPGWWGCQLSETPWD